MSILIKLGHASKRHYKGNQRPLKHNQRTNLKRCSRNIVFQSIARTLASAHDSVHVHARNIDLYNSQEC